MSLIKAAQQAWAAQQVTNEIAEREHQELIKSRAIELMERLVNERLKNYAWGEVSEPVYSWHKDLEDGDIEVFFYVDDLLFRACSRDDVRRLYLEQVGRVEIFDLAHLGRVLEEQGLR